MRASPGRTVLLLAPFVFIAWFQWLRSVPQLPMRPVHIDPRDLALMQIRKQHAARRAARRAAEERWSQQVPQQNSTDGVRGATLSVSKPKPRHPEARALAPIADTSRRCPPSRKPFHVVLTATGQVYQQWQCRIMYFHWKKQRDNDPAGACTELTGFTRLVASMNGNPDGIQDEVPSVFVKEYGGRELSQFRGYRVINRPHSILQFLETAAYKAIQEDFIYIAETDHIMMHPLPNKAELGSPMAYIFNYMGPNPAHRNIINRVWPEGGSNGYQHVQSIGPSPVVIHKRDLEQIAKPWNQIAISLKTNQEADNALGWVIEMWGYAIAAAKIGLKHQVFADFQVEPGALSSPSQMKSFSSRYWVFHYTYQFEYMLDGTPCKPWTIGEFSLDKRHFSEEYPIPPLPQPPKEANEAAFYLLNAWNEAMLAIPAWPKQSAPRRQLLYGRRRLDWFSRHENGFATEMRTMPLVSRLGDMKFQCLAGSLTLAKNGDAHRGGGRPGRWGTMNDPDLGDTCPVYKCVFVDFGGDQRNGAIVEEGGKVKQLHLLTNIYRRQGGDNKPEVCVSL